MWLHILSGRGCTIPIFPCTMSCCFVLCVFHSKSSCMQPRWLIYFCRCCLHKHILQPSCCLSLSSFALQILSWLMCLVLHVIIWPIFMVYECPLWLLLLGSTMTLCVHGPLSFHCTATVDPAEKTEGFFKYYCFCIFDGPLRLRIVFHHFLYVWVLC